MRIAEQVVKNGMAAQGALLKFLSDFIAEKEITSVLESGTYLGTGSTMAIIDGLTRHGKEFEFHSIEVNPGHYCQAEKNVPKLRGVNLHLGVSVPKSKLPTEVKFGRMPEDIIVDHKPEHREALYLKEVDYDVEEDLIGTLLKKFTPELVFLDSAGHMGWVEYQHLLSKYKGEYYLVLDDVEHVKHYKSAKDARKNFEVVFETSDKFGALCVLVKN